MRLDGQLSTDLLEMHSYCLVASPCINRRYSQHVDCTNSQRSTRLFSLAYICFQVHKFPFLCLKDLSLDCTGRWKEQTTSEIINKSTHTNVVEYRQKYLVYKYCSDTLLCQLHLIRTVAQQHRVNISSSIPRDMARTSLDLLLFFQFLVFGMRILFCMTKSNFGIPQ